MKKRDYDVADLDQISDYATISQVAHMYYDLGILQPRIAEKLYFSRSKVSRMLSKARELGIVDIKVKRFVNRLPNIENVLFEKFPQTRCIVLTSFDDARGEESTIDAITNFAAMYVSDRVKGECVIGITGGGTISRVAGKLQKIHPCRAQVVQLIGASTNTYVAGDLRYQINHVSKVYEAEGHFLNTPLYIDDLYAKEILLRDPTIESVFSLMKKCDLVLTGIGIFDVSGDMPDWYGYINDAHREELRRLGAVGSLCAQYFDREGRLLDCEWNRKCIAMPWRDMKSARETIAIAAGERKAAPILAALRGQLADIIITDANTAARVIELNRQIDGKER
ncbi:MAG: sugar-binding domain-containing protein [Clostridia bacterium]|nr:sugar-binding domain-containing protein [Clostridia bacterium]